MEDFWIEAIELTQSVIDGLLFGSTYALIGIGFTLIFGAMHKLNMTYAAASIAGAYVGLVVFVFFSAHPLLVFAVSSLASGLIGLLVYLICFRFIPVNNHLAALMATVGALFFIDEVIIHITNASPLAFPALFGAASFDLGAVWIRGDLLFVFAASVASTAALLYVLYRTRLGLATRAVSQQNVAAQLCGIDVHRTNATTFVVAGLLGGIAGAMTAASVGVLSPLLTLPITVKGLIVTVVGGLGSIPGAIIAGLMVGAAENVFLYLRGVNERDIYVLLLLFVFLVFRPNGIFGKSINRD
ncbi:MAG: branched-chain amino acid ABC transporter permease [Gammaproteobacteria bacterium]|nr:branched-chain amino acid ABC transporter permease [Gammaproteobacteria bacterium]MDD9799680.1 branched-chain amino acid ABC transporter permease [Gammaproteobacteria bacterium]MDD9814492.1 branched-chain amino acid ABC transporter permease [Gammaproteobacteria bacterium]MDD9850221.1 branched-chain amino acid ABC transporter permease [Gammaproteobacteria bacterium]MDD9871835.1 branched-chain amino acid ABC transporter permease [Gammaproteobacteria bacterium]